MGAIQVRNTVTGLTEYVSAEGDGLTPETAFKPIRTMDSFPTKIKPFTIISTGSASYIIHTPSSGNSIELFAIQLTADANQSYEFREGDNELLSLVGVGLWLKEFPAPSTYTLDINQPLSIEVTGTGTTKGFIHYREV